MIPSENNRKCSLTNTLKKHSNYQQSSIDDTLGISPEQSSTRVARQKLGLNNAVDEMMRGWR